MKKMNKKITVLLLALAGFSFSLFAQSTDEGQVDVQIKKYLENDVDGDTSLTKSNVTWETTLDNLGNEIEAAYFSGSNSWLEIADKPLSATTEISGFTISFKAKLEKSSGWSRIIDINNRSNISSNFSATVGNYLFLNLGNGAKLETDGIYDQQTFEIAYAYPGRNTEARSAYFNHGADTGSGNLKTGVTTNVELTETTAPITGIDTLYDQWHEFKLIVARTGYSTLVVDGKPIVWISESSTNSSSITNVVENLKTVKKGVYDFPDYYIGKSPYGSGDGFMKGYMRDLTFKCKADMYYVEDSSDPDGGYWTDGADVTRYYSIDFVSNGGSKCEQLVVAEIPTLPTPTLSGFNFGGWYLDSKFETPVPAKGTKLSTLGGGITLYAKWTHPSHDGLTFTVWTDNQTLPSAAGTYVLAQNIQLSSTWNAPAGTTIIDLNGNRISNKAGTGSVLNVASGRTLKIYDCNSLGKNYTFIENDGQWQIDSSNGTKLVIGGIIYGCSNGGIVNAGTLEIYGGTVVGNSSTNGGGINNTGTFTMKGGAVRGNKATRGGGVYNNGTMNVSGTVLINENTTNLYLLSGKKLNITGPLSVNSKIKLTTASTANPSILTNGYGANNAGVKFTAIFSSDNSNLKLMLMGEEIYTMKRKSSW